MENHRYKFSTFFWRVTASHIISYFLMGILAANLLNYEEVFNNSNTLRPYDSPWIAAGPSFQIIRGLIFSLALWYFKSNFLFRKYGWLKLWGLIVGLCILSTAGAPPGSVEGFVYTNLPFLDQIKGYVEVMPQTGLFAFFVCYWYDHPKKPLNVTAGCLVGLILFMSAMGVLASIGVISIK